MSREPLASPAAGHRLAGRYELVTPIASGGMAQVWRATDHVLGRSVAVKILHPHLAGDRAFVARFRREAVAAARLSHAGIVSIYDTVSAPGTEAIVMELVEGRTLRSELDRTGRLPVDRTIGIGIGIADALAEAHRNGVVHRDVKPSNILLCDDGRVKVTDFGIAKAGEDTDLTVTGTLLGTAKYLSPEQVRGDASDPRSDLYSLGVVLFEMLTGRPPFRADTDAATALARLQQPAPRVRRFAPEVPQHLDDLIDRLLRRESAERPARALDLRTALSGIRPDAEPPEDATLVVADATPLPPDLQEELEEDELDDFLRSERAWLLPATMLILAAAALVVIGLLFARSPIGERVRSATPDDATTVGSDDREPTDTTRLTNVDEVRPAEPTGARAIDPEGDGTEQNETAGDAIDGDESTWWRTERYRDAGFANLKSGVGLIIDLGGPSIVDDVELRSPTLGWSAELYVGEGFDDPATWGEPVVVIPVGDGDRRVDLDGAIGRQLLIWVTDPGTSEDRDENGERDHRFELLEVRFG